MLNSVNLYGRICNDLELKKTTNGTSVMSFTIAVDRDYTSGEEKQTDFINCVAWKSTAEFISNYFHKGKSIVISGSIQTRKYTTQSGENRYITEVIARNVYFAGDKTENANKGNFASENGTSNNTPDFAYNVSDDDLPF